MVFLRNRKSINLAKLPRSIFFWVVCFLLLANDALAQVTNGNFAAGGTGWTVTGPANSSIAFTGGQAVATSDDNGGGASTTLASQTIVTADPGFLSYLLVSYTSTDVADWDWPLFRVNGTNFRVSTTGALVASVQNVAGVVTNGTGASNLSGFTTLPAGTHTIGPGVFSVDSVFGAGVARWDNIAFQQITQSPSAQSTIENTPLVLTGGNALRTATNASGTFTISLSVTNGILNLGSPGSVTITAGSNGSSALTFTGTAAQINTAMGSLTYTPNLNYTGGDTLVYTATGGGISDTDTIVLTVTPGTRSITVSKTADNTVNVPAGVTVTYTYVVTNNGNQVISNVTLADAHNGSGPTPTPGNETLTTDAGTPGDSSDGGVNGVWDTLAPGDQVTFTASYVVTQSDIDTLQ
jgi:hypothetical protein